MSLRVPGAVDISSLELTVLDSAASCDGPDARGGTELLVTDVELGVPETITVSSGVRTFSVVGLDGTNPVARGCATQELEPGGDHTVDISLVELGTGPDGGTSDGGVPDGGMRDGGVPDGGVPDGGMGPPNDTCSDAEVIVAGLNTSGTLDGAGDEQTPSCGTSGERDVFYEFELTAERAVTVLLNSSQDTAVVLLAGDCATELACLDATSGGEQLEVPVLSPGTYHLAVEGVDGSAGAFTIGYTTSDPRPPNDHCEGAIGLTDGVARVGDSTVNARDDAAGPCGGSGSGDVAYSFSIPNGGNKRARVTVSNASGFDPILYARENSCTGAGVGCAQTRTDDSEILDVPDLPPGDYVVWLDAAGGGEGTYDILLELLDPESPPGNDTCAAPDALVAGTPEIHSTVGANDDYAPACLVDDSRDTVHQIDLASDQAVLVSIAPQAPTWNAAAALRALSDCGTGPEISCATQRWFPLYINQPSLSAGSYALLVDGDSGAVGDYEVSYEVASPDTTFGYWMLDGTDTFESIAGTDGAVQRTIPLSPSGDLDPGDEWSEPIELPFSFDYYGTTYPADTVINAHSNMFLTFDTPPTGSDSWDHDCPLDSSTPTNAIAMFWGDGISKQDSGAEMWTKIEGQAPHRRLIIEYKNWDMLDCGGPNCTWLVVKLHQQAILYENGDIEFRYGPRQAPSANEGCGTQHTGCASVIGIEGETNDGTDIDQLQCNTDGIEDGRFVYFVHPR